MQAAMPLPERYTCKVFHGFSEPDLFRRIAKLRFEVWDEVLDDARSTFPEGIWREAADEVSHHWAVFDEAQSLVATTRLTLSAEFRDLYDAWWYTEPRFVPRGPVAFLARKVVEKGHRGGGLSSWLYHDQLRWARKLGASTVLVRVLAVGQELFSKRGFELVQAPKPGVDIAQLEWATFVLALDGRPPAEP